MKIMGGIQDVPREAGEEDLLGIENHIIGMADFIRQTTPPFNISIHGEWGSGKTTFMYRLKEQLKEPSDGNIRQVYFDASDFDSVNQNHSVAYYYINHLLEELNKEAKDRTKQLMDEIKKLSFCLFSASVETFSEKYIGEGFFSKFMGKINDKPAEKLIDTTYENIKELKDKFEEMISELCRTHHMKLVVYIDNLDRLLPLRAVLFLDSIKTFFCNKHTIHIVAVDFEVIRKGLMQKYSIDENDIKSQEYFEKYFQLNYRVPKEAYQMKNIIKEYLQVNDKEKKDVITCVEAFGLKNPRKLKIILNRINLVKLISNKKMNRSLCTALVLEQMNLDLFHQLLNNATDEDETNEILNRYISEKTSLEKIFAAEKSNDLYTAFVINIQNDGNLIAPLMYEESRGVRKQNHTPNKDVQWFIRKLANYILGEKRFDLINSENFGKETRKQREGEVSEQCKELYGVCGAIRITNAKGQGICLSKVDSRTDAVYLSGDYKGTLLNDGIWINGQRNMPEGLYKVNIAELRRQGEKVVDEYIEDLLIFIRDNV